MYTHSPTTYLQMRSLVGKAGGLQLYLEELPMPALQANEVMIRVEAAPLNPSDIGLLFGTADLTTARLGGSATRPIILADIRSSGMPSSGAMYAEYRAVSADQCLVLPNGTTAVEGAAAFVNPMTALGMLDTLRREGHKALIHTAAASNLGQMLNRVCLQDNVPLVNVVRTAEQANLLREAGALHVCNSASPDFFEQLSGAIITTGATIAFDATGGGTLASTLLSAMEAAASKNMTGYSRYGSNVHKQVYLYGGLDARPTSLLRDYGMAWSVGGWFVGSFMQKTDVVTLNALKSRIAGELKTTFMSRYTRKLTLTEVLSLGNIAAFSTMSTGQKYLVTPTSAD